MVAARRFVLHLKDAHRLGAVCRLRVDLYGSLAHTGKGHGTDRAVVLGLYGMEPEAADAETTDRLIRSVHENGVLELLGERPVPFSRAGDIVFRCGETLDFHSNGMTFTAFNWENEPPIRAENLYSIGGGFVVGDEGPQVDRSSVRVLFPFHSATELLHWCRQTDLNIWELVLRNESAWRGKKRPKLESTRSGRPSASASSGA